MGATQLAVRQSQNRIASINGDTTAAQILAGGDDIAVSDSGATRTIRRLLRSGVNNYAMLPYQASASAGAVIGSANQVRVLRMYFPDCITVAKICYRMGNTVSGKFSSWGIYLDNVSAAVINTGAQAHSAGQNQITLGSAYNLRPQIIYIAWTADDSTVTFTSLNVGDANTMEITNGGTAQYFTAGNTSVAGALPSTLGTLTTNTASLVMPLVKLQG